MTDKVAGLGLLFANIHFKNDLNEITEIFLNSIRHTHGSENSKFMEVLVSNK